jgi:hypothetical protein
MAGWRGITALALLALALGGNLPWVAGAAHAAELPADEPRPSIVLSVDETEILILEVLVERYLASRGVLGYRHGDRVLLPVGELAAALELAIVTDPYAGIAEGWIGDEDSTFLLDVANRSVTVDGRQQGIEEPCLYVDPDDIYVASDVLSQWWPVDMDVDLRGMRVQLKARAPVPLISRLEREKAWDKLNQGRRRDVEYPRQLGEYRTIGWPFLDATVSWDANRDRSVLKGSLLSRSDLARMSVTGFAGYAEDSENEWTGWLRAERTDPEAGLLGPLGATHLELGDVVGRPSQFIKGTTRGRGVRLTNRPLGSVTEFGATDVTGDAPPGWEAELYRDGYLHAIQTVGDRGNYVFEDIPLHPGVNTLRVVLYGPNGQTREDVRTVNITSSMWAPGSVKYELLSHQSGESVVGTPTATFPPEDLGHWIHSLSLGVGLREGTSLDLSGIRRWTNGRDHDYLQARILQSVDRVLLEGRGINDLDGGRAVSASAQTRLGGHSLLLSHGYFDGFESDESQYEQNLRHQSEVRLSGSYRRAGSSLLNYRLDWQGSQYDEGEFDRRDLLRLYLGRGVGRFQLGHDLDYTRTSGDQGASDDLHGRLQASGFVRGARLRFDADYDLMGSPGVNALGAGLNWRFTRDLTAQLSARRLLRGTENTTVQANLDWHLDRVRLGLRAGYDTETEEYIGLSATTSLARAPGRGWLLSSRTNTRHGAALAHTYIDLNDNGVFDQGDQPMEEVGFGRNPLWHDIQTDAEGYAFLPGLPADRFVNVLVDLNTVADPYLVTESEGLTTLVHSGGVAKLNFPFQIVGEIEGLVMSRPDMRPLRNVGLELIDEAGNRVATAVSEFDGYYLFDRVKPGTYRIRVVMSTLREGVYHEPDPADVDVPAGGDYVAGPTVYLDRIVPLVEDELLVAEVAVDEEPEPAPVEPVVVAEAAPASESATTTAPSGSRSGAGASVVRGDDGEEPVSSDVTPGDAVTTDQATTELAATEPAASPPSTIRDRTATPPAVGEGVAPDVNRTLHLIHELLFQSPLFAR